MKIHGTGGVGKGWLSEAGDGGVSLQFGFSINKWDLKMLFLTVCNSIPPPPAGNNMNGDLPTTPQTHAEGTILNYICDAGTFLEPTPVI